MLARNTLAMFVALALIGFAPAAFAGNGLKGFGFQQVARSFGGGGNGNGGNGVAKIQGQGQGQGQGNGGQKALNILLGLQRGLGGNQGFGNQQQCQGNPNCNRPCNNNPLPQQPPMDPAPTEETPPTDVPAEEGAPAEEAPAEEAPGETPTGEEGAQFNVLPGQKMTFQVEAENRPGSGFARLVRNLGTFSTQAKADQIAALYRSEGYAVRITSMPAAKPALARPALQATSAKLIAKQPTK